MAREKKAKKKKKSQQKLVKKHLDNFSETKVVQEMQNGIMLKNGNMDGLLVPVKIKLNTIKGSGKIVIENPSALDGIWDITFILKVPKYINITFKSKEYEVVSNFKFYLNKIYWQISELKPNNIAELKFNLIESTGSRKIEPIRDPSYLYKEFKIDKLCMVIKHCGLMGIA